MNFDFSDEQKMLKEFARKFLKERCPRDVVRRVLDGGPSYDGDLWRGIVELEWPGTAIAEEFGGIGYGYLELCVVAEELGRALAPLPFSSSVYLAGEAIQLAGTDEQKRRYLPRLAAGEIIGTFALAEGPGPADETNINTHLRDGTLYGTKLPVADGDVADLAVVAARSSEVPQAVSLFLVELAQKGVKRQRIETIDPTRSHARVTFDKAVGEPLGTTEAAWPLVERLMERAAVLVAFEQLGGADAALEMATEYAKNRYAFARPIGSFQAIKHKLADAFIANELARSNCYYAAWALSTDAADLPIAAASARIAATQAFAYIAAENIQTHGGVGFTWESDCQLFYRRAKLLALSLGGVHRWKNRLIDQLEKQATVELEAVGAKP
jgi:alkylation response protein AidB-like acyl-CoA dehydrogenase